MSQLALEARGLGKRYGRRAWALRGVDLAVPIGGIVALVGPNAAGKSTLIRSWMGFERSTEGQALVLGLDPADEATSVLTKIGYVAQSPSLFSGLTVDHHLSYAESLRPGFDVVMAAERLATLGIPMSAKARSLSGGQIAQVVLSLALATHPQVLLLDEPLAALDPLARIDFLRLLRTAISGQATTCLLSSHVVTELAEVADRLIVLGVGHVLLEGGVNELLASHAVGASGERHEDYELIANFTDVVGSGRTLWRKPEDSGAAAGRRATLDEVVLGYFAAGRASSPVVLA